MLAFGIGMCGNVTTSDGPPTSGLQFWATATESYSFADGGGSKVTANGGTVASLKDLSGNSRHWNVLSGSPTLVTSIQNGYPAVSFSGGNYAGWASDLNLSQPYTIHLLCMAKSAANDQVIIAGSQSNDSMWMARSTYLMVSAGNNQSLSNTLLPVDSVTLVSLVVNGSSSYYKFNNGSTSSAVNLGTRALKNLYYGKGYYSDAVYSGASDVLECLVYNTAQDLDSTAVGDAVRTYFNNKYSFGWTIN